MKIILSLFLFIKDFSLSVTVIPVGIFVFSATLMQESIQKSNKELKLNQENKNNDIKRIELSRKELQKKLENDDYHDPVNQKIQNEIKNPNDYRYTITKLISKSIKDQTRTIKAYERNEDRIKEKQDSIKLKDLVILPTAYFISASLVEEISHIFTYSNIGIVTLFICQSTLVICGLLKLYFALREIEEISEAVMF